MCHTYTTHDFDQTGIYSPSNASRHTKADELSCYCTYGSSWGLLRRDPSRFGRGGGVQCDDGLAVASFKAGVPTCKFGASLDDDSRTKGLSLIHI